VCFNEVLVGTHVRWTMSRGISVLIGESQQRLGRDKSDFATDYPFLKGNCAFECTKMKGKWRLNLKRRYAYIRHICRRGETRKGLSLNYR
jgi:hypothetical protein